MLRSVSLLRSIGVGPKGWSLLPIQLPAYSGFTKNKDKAPTKTKAEAEADQASHKEVPYFLTVGGEDVDRIPAWRIR